jgi:hypothetical protein
MSYFISPENYTLMSNALPFIPQHPLESGLSGHQWLYFMGKKDCGE